jgi:hypothetical protein
MRHEAGRNPRTNGRGHARYVVKKRWRPSNTSWSNVRHITTSGRGMGKGTLRTNNILHRTCQFYGKEEVETK